MMNPVHLETLLKQVVNVLPLGVLTLHQDLEKNLRATLEFALRRMNLVTREEFDVQSAVLTRTRARLEALEAKISTLEAVASVSKTMDTTESNSTTAA